LKVAFFCCAESSRARDFAEAQRLVAARLHLPHQEKHESGKQAARAGHSEELNPVAAANFLHAELHRFVAADFW